VPLTSPLDPGSFNLEHNSSGNHGGKGEIHFRGRERYRFFSGCRCQAIPPLGTRRCRDPPRQVPPWRGLSQRRAKGRRRMEQKRGER
jgi:hypothetical protein